MTRDDTDLTWLRLYADLMGAVRRVSGDPDPCILAWGAEGDCPVHRGETARTVLLHVEVVV